MISPVGPVRVLHGPPWSEVTRWAYTSKDFHAFKKLMNSDLRLYQYY